MSPKEFRRIREKLEINQRDLAETFGYSTYTPISHYESGFRNPSQLVGGLMRLLDSLPEKKAQDLFNLLRRSMKLEPLTFLGRGK